MTKVTREQVRYVREQAAAGVRTNRIAVECGLHPGTVRQIATGKKYPELGGPIQQVRRKLKRDATRPEQLALAAVILASACTKAANGCWLYPNVDWGGYGRLRLASGPSEVASRVAFEVANGPVPAGLVIDHQCHNADRGCVGGISCLHRRCVNPDHLVARTRTENVLLGRVGLTNRSKTCCPRGHPYAGENLMVRYREGKYGRSCRICHRKQTFESVKALRERRALAAADRATARQAFDREWAALWD